MIHNAPPTLGIYIIYPNETHVGLFTVYSVIKGKKLNVYRLFLVIKMKVIFRNVLR